MENNKRKVPRWRIFVVLILAFVFVRLFFKLVNSLPPIQFIPYQYMDLIFYTVMYSIAFTAVITSFVPFQSGNWKEVFRCYFTLLPFIAGAMIAYYLLKNAVSYRIISTPFVETLFWMAALKLWQGKFQYLPMRDNPKWIWLCLTMAIINIGLSYIVIQHSILSDALFEAQFNAMKSSALGLLSMMSGAQVVGFTVEKTIIEFLALFIDMLLIEKFAFGERDTQ